jgi:hypothetical protein
MMTASQGAVTLSSVNVVLPIITGVAGFFSSFVLSWLQDYRTRRSSRIERRNEFQRETLIELQEASSRLLHAVVQRYRLVKERGATESADLRESDWAVIEADNQCLMLKVRLRFAEVTSTLSDFLLLCSKTHPSVNLDTSKKTVLKALEKFGELNTNIGAVLRTLDEKSGD